MAPVSVFLLAHQDDEFGVFESILREREAGVRIQVAYLTTGVPLGSTPDVRNEESLRVLARLGVPAQDVQFAGAALGISDGSLREQLPAVIGWLSSRFARWQGLQRMYVPAWEGGHPDHDALHAAAVIAATASGAAGKLRQFPLYNAHRCPGPLFRVMAPLADNGTVERISIPWRRRLRFIGHCMSYPSQFKSWLGLLPFAALHYLITGEERVQPVSGARLVQRPHEGTLYYEKRRFGTWAQMQQSLATWVTPAPDAAP